LKGLAPLLAQFDILIVLKLDVNECRLGVYYNILENPKTVLIRGKPLNCDCFHTSTRL